LVNGTKASGQPIEDSVPALTRTWSVSEQGYDLGDSLKADIELTGAINGEVRIVLRNIELGSDKLEGRMVLRQGVGKPVRAAPATPETPKRKRGRPKKGEVVAQKEPRRLERQASMTLAEMLTDLPTCCNVGTKSNAKGRTTGWIGYKLHIDTADGDIPISCLLTAASVHDSQVAIPLAIITAGRVTNLYDLMDSAYDAPEIREKSRALGHVPIIDSNPRRGGKAEAEAEARARRCARYDLAEDVRYNQPSSAERVNASLKGNRGGNHVRVRGAPKVFCHLMFAILVVTVEQMMRLVT
jgi:hypothetical protein